MNQNQIWQLIEIEMGQISSLLWKHIMILKEIITIA